MASSYLVSLYILLLISVANITVSVMVFAPVMDELFMGKLVIVLILLQCM